MQLSLPPLIPNTRLRTQMKYCMCYFSLPLSLLPRHHCLPRHHPRTRLCSLASRCTALGALLSASPHASTAKATPPLPSRTSQPSGPMPSASPRQTVCASAWAPPPLATALPGEVRLSSNLGFSISVVVGGGCSPTTAAARSSMSVSPLSPALS